MPRGDPSLLPGKRRRRATGSTEEENNRAAIRNDTAVATTMASEKRNCNNQLDFQQFVNARISFGIVVCRRHRRH